MSNELTSSANPTSDEFYSSLHRDLFLFKELVKAKDTLKICYNKGKICCSLTYEMGSKRSDEMYALGVYDGKHASRNPFHFRACTLIKCGSLDRKSCGERVSNAKTIFKSILLKSQLNSPNVFPQLVADGVTLLPGQWTNGYPATDYLQTTKRLTKGLVEAALYTRVYSLDATTKADSSTIGSTNSDAGDSKLFLLS
jgi:hypothetical protein